MLTFPQPAATSTLVREFPRMNFNLFSKWNNVLAAELHYRSLGLLLVQKLFSLLLLKWISPSVTAEVQDVSLRNWYQKLTLMFQIDEKNVCCSCTRNTLRYHVFYVWPVILKMLKRYCVLKWIFPLIVGRFTVFWLEHHVGVGLFVHTVQLCHFSYQEDIYCHCLF